MPKLFELSLKLNGFPIAEAKLQFYAIRAIPDRAYQDYIHEKRKAIAKYHLDNNAFYRKMADGRDGDDWDALPVLTKKDLQIPLHDRLSDEYKQQKIFINKTSGSSGDPFVFAKDKSCHALTWASYIYRFGNFGIDFNSSLQARFYGIPLDFVGNTKERIKDYLVHRYRFPIFDLSDKVLAQFLEHFKTKKFDYINGYTSSIALFAKFLEKNDVILKNVCPTLKVCVVTSEMLFEEDKVLMEKQLGVPVINEYGASELDLIAFRNLDGEWQMNSETIFVEILDENNQAVPHGQEGRVVITSLYNQAHPFIRYDIGDIAIVDEKSTYKKQILKQLIGRTNDVAILPSGKKSPGLTFYYVTKSIIEDDGNVKEFIIKQVALDTFEVEYVSEAPLTNTQIQKIEAAIALYLEPGLNFTFLRREVLERTKRGKLKQFKSML